MNKDEKLKNIYNILDDIIINYDSTSIDGIYEDSIIHELEKMQKQIFYILIKSLGTKQFFKNIDIYKRR